VAAKFTANEVALVDAARGDMTRSAWLREAALKAARIIPASSRREILARPPAAGRYRPAVARKDCRHPDGRRLGNWCADCEGRVR
jgi:hypothetical protein